MASEGVWHPLERNFFPRELCCVLELRLSQPKGAEGSWGNSPGSARAPQPPATHLMWKFWMLTFL